MRFTAKMPLTLTKRGRITSVLTLASLSIGLAACGSTSASLASSKSATTKGASSLSRAAYRNCLTAHGFTFPSFNANSKVPPSTVPQSVRNAAVAACAKLGPGASGGAPGFTLSKNQQQALAAYTACLKSHGVTVASTAQSGGFRAVSKSPGFNSAAKACASLRPKFGGAGGRGGPQTFSTQHSSTTTAG